jgi:hypothetical protein
MHGHRSRASGTNVQHNYTLRTKRAAKPKMALVETCNSTVLEHLLNRRSTAADIKADFLDCTVPPLRQIDASAHGKVTDLKRSFGENL